MRLDKRFFNLALTLGVLSAPRVTSASSLGQFTLADLALSMALPPSVESLEDELGFR